MSNLKQDFKERRKWQIALRRYVIDEHKSAFYAPYFGLDIQNFRDWIELQFDSDLNWKNFGSSWQFSHIAPVAYFNLSDDNDLKLFWNFVNTKVQRTDSVDHQNLDILSIRQYFERLNIVTGLEYCNRILQHINKFEKNQSMPHEPLEIFLKENIEYLTAVSTFSQYEFEQLNLGVPFSDVLAERKMLSRF